MSASSADMTGLLGRPAAAVKPPPSLPPGTYLFQIFNVQSSRKSQAGNIMVDFFVNAIQAKEVPPEQLEGIDFPFEFSGAKGAGGYPVAVTEKSVFRLVGFLRDTLKLPIPDESSGDTTPISAWLPQAIGKLFWGDVTLQPSRNQADNRMFPTISAVHPAE